MMCVLTAEDLRKAGRTPSVPFSLRLADGSEVLMERLLRVLPGRRVVGAASYRGQRVLAKLFIDPRRSARDCNDEREGIEALLAADVATPQLVLALPLAAGGHALLLRFLDDARTLNDLAPDELRQALPEAFALVGQMHAKGLRHDDLHLGNFLLAQKRVYLVDGDAVSGTREQQPLATERASKNLALLIAQLGLSVRRAGLAESLRSYAAKASPLVLDETQLMRDITAASRRREQSFLRKCLRDCTQFAVKKSQRRFTVVVRDRADELAQLLADPDTAMASGKLLKDGHTCTVSRVRLNGRDLVIKRYNIKNMGHALSRSFRPSRAWHSWQAGNRLRLLGMDTPRPLALIEERLGPLRRRAWLITDYCPGVALTDLSGALSTADAPGNMLAAVSELFANLREARLVHGDMKANNLLWDGEHLQLIDLDAMRQEGSLAAWRKGATKDRERLLRNWPVDSPLRAELSKRVTVR